MSHNVNTWKIAITNTLFSLSHQTSTDTFIWNIISQCVRWRHLLIEKHNTTHAAKQNHCRNRPAKWTILRQKHTTYEQRITKKWIRHVDTSEFEELNNKNYSKFKRLKWKRAKRNIAIDENILKNKKWKKYTKKKNYSSIPFLLHPCQTRKIPLWRHTTRVCPLVLWRQDASRDFVFNQIHFNQRHFFN